jgi:hypothetical protein
MLYNVDYIIFLRAELKYFEVTIEYGGTQEIKVLATDEDDAKEKAEEEAERLVAKEIEKKRQAEIAPDREKLLDLAMTIRQIISPPAIKDEIAKEIVETILVALSVIADNLEEQSEEL